MATQQHLREQLSQIEQGLGVCKVAQLSLWPNNNSVGDVVHVNTQVPRNSNLGRGNIVGGGHHFQTVPPRNQNGVVNVQQQHHQASTYAQHNRSVGDTQQAARELAVALGSLEGASIQIRRPAERPLEPAPPRPAPNTSLMSVVCDPMVGRLPVQVADLRHYTRRFGSQVEALQCSLHLHHSMANIQRLKDPFSNEEGPEEMTLQSLQAIHAATMDQARHLLALLAEPDEVAETVAETVSLKSETTFPAQASVYQHYVAQPVAAQ